jgi:mono/diheme cytochrome c family protein
MSLRSGVIGAVMLAALGARPALGQELQGYSGAQLFQRFCAACHGIEARGDGPVAPFFKVRPPDLTRLAHRYGGKFPAAEVRKTIDGRSNLLPHGERTMPVWGLEFMLAEGGTQEARERAETLISRLVDYLASIQEP